MKLNIHAGHTLAGTPGSGAVGLVNESTEVRKIKDEVISLLRKEGHTVYDCTNDRASSSSENLRNIVSLANKNKVDLDISIHLNAAANDSKGDGKTTGVEVLIYSDGSKAKNEAQRICNEIASLGFKNRGVKVRNGLYVLKNTNASTLLIECFFVDDRDDVNLYNKVGVNAIAKAIVQGILGKKLDVIVEPIKAVPSPSPAKPIGNSYLVQITASALNVRNDAGTNYKINTSVKKGDVFTIVEEKNGWGKLKSGAGWISLNYTKRV